MNFPGREELTRQIDTFSNNLFRLETLPVYTVGEAEQVRAFIEGRPEPPQTPATNPWYRKVADSVAAGKQWRRVHVLDLPLTDYLRWEVATYAESAKLGYETLLVDRDAHPDLEPLGTDFYLFDEERVVLLHYDDEGRPLRAERADDQLEQRRRERDLALTHAMPLDEYVARHKERLTV